MHELKLYSFAPSGLETAAKTNFHVLPFCRNPSWKRRVRKPPWLGTWLLDGWKLAKWPGMPQRVVVIKWSKLDRIFAVWRLGHVEVQEALQLHNSEGDDARSLAVQLRQDVKAWPLVSWRFFTRNERLWKWTCMQMLQFAREPGPRSHGHLQSLNPIGNDLRDIRYKIYKDKSCIQEDISPQCLYCLDAAFVVACTGFAPDNQILPHLKRIAPAWHGVKSLALWRTVVQGRWQHLPGVLETNRS